MKTSPNKGTKQVRKPRKKIAVKKTGPSGGGMPARMKKRVGTRRGR